MNYINGAAGVPVVSKVNPRTFTEIRFAVERYADVIEEGKPLLIEHWSELATYSDIPLDPEYEFYRKMDEVGALKIFTARKDGLLIGYSIFVIRPRHGHYHVGYAINDIIIVRPEHRNMGVGTAFVAYWDGVLHDLGVTFVHIDTKINSPELLHLLTRCGYAPVTTGVEKRLR
jgi:GNAT superfamily N-acetyltransferase